MEMSFLITSEANQAILEHLSLITSTNYILAMQRPVFTSQKQQLRLLCF